MAAIANYVQEGDAIDYTPGADVAAGDVIDLGTFVGIAKAAIASGTLGALSLEGVFDVNKYSGESHAIGDTIYWDAGTSTATKTSAYSEATMGKCVKAAASGDSTTRVKLLPALGGA